MAKLDVKTVYDVLGDSLDCTGCWVDDDDEEVNCLDIGADVEDCCAACLGWWAICELKSRDDAALGEEVNPNA